ncbi:MAG TPA: hypothetical protein VIN61_05850 [Gammaproteobacteria bacterium]
MALVALLRGVNVGGHRTFRPTERATELKDVDVINIGAAGTFVVRRPITRARLRAELESWLRVDAVMMICRGQDILEPMSSSRFEDRTAGPDIVRDTRRSSRAERAGTSLHGEEEAP